jgi:hypothetical protein
MFNCKKNSTPVDKEKLNDTNSKKIKIFAGITASSFLVAGRVLIHPAYTNATNGTNQEAAKYLFLVGVGILSYLAVESKNKEILGLQLKVLGSTICNLTVTDDPKIRIPLSLLLTIPGLTLVKQSSMKDRQKLFYQIGMISLALGFGVGNSNNLLRDCFLTAGPFAITASFWQNRRNHPHKTWVKLNIATGSISLSSIIYDLLG